MRESHQLLEPETFAERRAINRTQAVARTSPIVWLNLVCLDAPIVAITWQWLFARSFHFSLPIASQAALFLSAWLIYLADRLADSWILRGEEPLSLRQQFCQRHQIGWFVSIAALTIVDLWIICRLLDRATIEIGALLGAISIAYLSVNYWLGKIWRFIPVKEMCIGLLFATGTAAALLPRLHFSREFFGSFVLFAALCSLNCIGIAMWERELDRAQHKNSIATRWHGVGFYFRAGIIVLASLGIIAGFFSGTSASLYCCIAASALLLGILDWSGETILRDQRTALADLILLTPLFLLPFGVA